MKVLFVDDSSTTCAVYGTLLEKNGYEVLLAGSMAEALDVARAERPPLAIVDYYMPDGNGNELTEALLNDPETRDILVVMHSQRADMVEESLAAGAIDLIYKDDPQDVFLLRVAAMSRFVETQANQREIEVVQREKAFVESVLAAVPTALLVVRDQTIVTTNHTYGQMFGADVIDRNVIEVLRGWDCPADLVDSIARGDSFSRRESRWRCGPNEGDSRYVSVSQTMISPNSERLLAISDISERKRAEERLVYLARYDTVTGLANRSHFHTRLKEAIRHANRTERLLALLFLDLDHFKDINDTLGHFVGDLLLKQVAERLLACTRDTDTVARLGGDEFAVVATNVMQANNAAALAQKLIDTLVRPYELDGQEVITGASVGITLYPADATEPDQLLRNADMALYQVKSESRGSHQFYAPEMQARARARKQLETGLRHAVKQQEFSLHFQPVMSADSGEVVGTEALLRWRHPERGMIEPHDFVPVAESTGLIVPLGEWALREACAQCLAWREAGLPAIPVAVNLSPVQFKRAGLTSTVTRVLEETGIEPGWLMLEITESLMMDKTASVTNQLQTLHALGIHLAIDDFGSGYSSLAYLKRFPLDKLKIDGSFMENVLEDADADAIVKAIITLGKSINLRVVAEGVENEDQLAFLRTLGCDEIQGDLFSRPLSADAFAAWYRKRAKKMNAA
ncbi:MAG: EAL domain-containing protein [Alphaproteobacteria bacterium]